MMSGCNFVWVFNDAMEKFWCGLIQIKHIYAGVNLIICCCWHFFVAPRFVSKRKPGPFQLKILAANLCANDIVTMRDIL